MFPSQLEAQLDYYRSQHRTTGCKVTHLFGVPLIALAVPLVFINFRRAVACFIAGWILQFVGHFFFEKNKPVIISEATHPLVPVAALIVVSQLWMRVLTGKPLDEEVSGNGRLLPRKKPESFII
jgi:uncharacterized membrane protein YGL010W